MAVVKLNNVEFTNQSTPEEKIDCLANSVQALKKNLEYYLNNLDTDNILNIDSAIIENLKTTNVEAGNVLITEGADARVVLNATTIAMQVFENGAWVSKVYFDTVTRKYIFDGTLSATVIEVLSALITPNLYAEKGYIAELTVDTLDTGDKVGKYLLADTSDVNYIKIQDQYIYFVTASTDGSSTVQATNRADLPLYWTDATHTASTTEETAFPVTIYVYTEVVKQKMLFETDPNTGYYMPNIGFGAGDGVTPLSAKGQIIKGATGLWLKYWKSNTGELVQIGLTDDGIVMTDGLELSQLDFYANGFMATYGSRQLGYRWVKDGNGRIISMTNTKTAVTVPVNWNGGNL